VASDRNGPYGIRSHSHSAQNENCRDDETDTVTTRPLSEESESTLDASWQQSQSFQRPPRSVSFQLANVPPNDPTCYKWTSLDPEVIWWSKPELDEINRNAKQEAQEKIAEGPYRRFNAALADIQRRAKESQWNDVGVKSLAQGSSARQLVENARFVPGLHIFSPTIKAATALHLRSVLAVQRGLSENTVPEETKCSVLRKASLRASRASTAIAYLLARSNRQEVFEMILEELSKPPGEGKESR